MKNLNICDQKSPEGIPWKEYKLYLLILTLPFSVLLEFYFIIMRSLIKSSSKVDLTNLPKNSLLVTFHGESYLDPLAKELWQALKDINFFWLGYHGGLSYLIMLSVCYHKIACRRFDRSKKERPFEQTLKFLEEKKDSPMLLRTDAGGPYWKVRKSLVRMSLASNRPIVGLRLNCDKQFVLNKHKFALPGAHLKVATTKIIHPKEFKDLEISKACEYIENIIGGFCFK